MYGRVLARQTVQVVAPVAQRGAGPVLVAPVAAVAAVVPAVVPAPALAPVFVGQ
ncbi:hypothetical protein [Streptomyces sp. NPDC059008]|uniref:hypothetical protein n=1 Tax=Streptomyces sp. NPDC059008 TaxID=3346693 RepID=UPI003696DA17